MRRRVVYFVVIKTKCCFHVVRHCTLSAKFRVAFTRVPTGLSVHSSNCRFGPFLGIPPNTAVLEFNVLLQTAKHCCYHNIPANIGSRGISRSATTKRIGISVHRLYVVLSKIANKTASYRLHITVPNNFTCVPKCNLQATAFVHVS